jgi:hypothetical protein
MPRDSYYEGYSAGVGKPKVSNGNYRVTPTEKAEDDSILPEALRWFRRDDLVRKCIVINAAFATFSAGFDTEIEVIDNSLNDEQKQKLVEEFAYVKAFVDQVNRQVNFDKALFIAQVKRSIFGQSAYEIVTDTKGSPSWLLSLQSSKLIPKVTSDWKLEKLQYTGNDKVDYLPEEVLFFTNLQLENDYVGVSDVEPVFNQCSSRRALVKTDFPKIVKRLWAPYSVHQADTSMMSDAEENAFLDDLAAKAKAGENIVINKSVTSNVVDMHIDFAGLLSLKASLELDIISNFGTPRFLLNRPTENRATAYTEFEAYVAGPISMIQRDLKREVEAQWYPKLVKLALKLKGATGEVPVKICHVWRTIRVSDVYAMATAAAALYSNGLGLIGEHPEIGFDMMNFDKKVLDPNSAAPQTQAPKTEDQKKDESVTE